MHLKSHKVGIVSLGCPKALVDSERIITALRSEGYEIAPDYAGADVVLVNTCGFLIVQGRNRLKLSARPFQKMDG